MSGRAKALDRKVVVVDLTFQTSHPEVRTSSLPKPVSLKPDCRKVSERNDKHVYGAIWNNQSSPFLVSMYPLGYKSIIDETGFE